MTATLAPPEPDVALDYPDTLLIANHPDTDPLDEDDVPEAFYTTNAPGNHIGQAGTYTRKTSWFLYRAILEVPRVLFLGICLDFYYFLRRVLLPKIGFHFDWGSVSQALVKPHLVPP